MVTWIVEDNVFPEYQNNLRNEVIRKGYRFEAITQPKYELASALTRTNSYKYLENPVIFHGSLGFTQRLMREQNWAGLWCDLPKFKCSNYYGKFGDRLLNSEYCLVPAGDFERLRESSLLQFIDENNSLFLRPDSGFKIFAGDTIKEDQTLKQFLVNSVLFDDDLILVAKPQRLHREWRFIICDGKVAGSSLYRKDGEDTTDGEVPSDVFEFVENCLDWKPETCYTLDICEDSDYVLKILELNSFSCSGFYKSNLESIVRLASEAAIKEYEELS